MILTMMMMMMMAMITMLRMRIRMNMGDDVDADDDYVDDYDDEAVLTLDHFPTRYNLIYKPLAT